MLIFVSGFVCISFLSSCCSCAAKRISSSMTGHHTSFRSRDSHGMGAFNILGCFIYIYMRNSSCRNMVGMMEDNNHCQLIKLNVRFYIFHTLIMIAKNQDDMTIQMVYLLKLLYKTVDFIAQTLTFIDEPLTNVQSAFFFLDSHD